MFEYRNLKNTDLESIHRAFVDAFSDYEVKIDMPFEKFVEMLITRSYRGEYSYGCFDGELLVGFSLTGFRNIDGMKVCYDTGTGIKKELQGMGVAKNILKLMIKNLESSGINLFILEVLENNTAAQKVYTDNRFHISRKLRCYRFDASEIETEIVGYIVIDKPEEVFNLDIHAFCSFQPTWQNSMDSVKNILEKIVIIGLGQKNNINGYIICNRHNGNILQLGVAPDQRDKGLEKQLFFSLESELRLGKYSMLNIEDNSYICNKMNELGLENHINQFEMMREF